MVSALQKAIRRGQVNAALYWAAEMDMSGYTAWLWKRLLVIASEDVGMADPKLVSTIRDLRELHREMSKRDPAEGRLFVLHATYALAAAPKSRAIVMAACALYSDCHPRLDVPDEALDRHTLRGRKMGRSWSHFRDFAAVLDRHEPTPEEEHWDRLGYDVIEGRAEVVNPPVPRLDDDAPQLFDAR